MKTINSFKFKMVIIVLLYGSFKINSNKNIEVPKFPKKLEDTLMTNFSYSHLNTTQIKHHLTQ